VGKEFQKWIWSDAANVVNSGMAVTKAMPAALSAWPYSGSSGKMVCPLEREPKKIALQRSKDPICIGFGSTRCRVGTIWFLFVSSRLSEVHGIRALVFYSGAGEYRQRQRRLYRHGGADGLAGGSVGVIISRLFASWFLISAASAAEHSDI